MTIGTIIALVGAALGTILPGIGSILGVQMHLLVLQLKNLNYLVNY